MARCSLLFLLAIPAVLGLLVPSCMGANVLYTDQSLHTRQSLTNGNYKLLMQNDCNLVLSDNNTNIWQTGTTGRGNNCRVTMHSDRNLIVHTYNGTAVWTSNTGGPRGDVVLILQTNRNLVIYSNPIWSTRTNVTGTLGVVIASNNAATAVPVVVAPEADDDLGNRKIAMVTKN